jgi:type I restriction-modification system DNA methylase subunit
MRELEERITLIWRVAGLIRGTFEFSRFQDVLLPLTVLRRIDNLLKPTKVKVLAVNAELNGRLENPTPQLCKASGCAFYNISSYDFERLLDDPPHLAANLRTYIDGYSDNVREMLARFHFSSTISHLEQAGLLFPVMEKFRDIDLNPDKVSNFEMWQIIEKLIRRFSTPYELLKLPLPPWLIDFMTKYLEGSTVKSIFDPRADSLLLIYAAASTQPETALGRIQNTQIFEIVSLLNPFHNVTWRLGEPLDTLVELKEDFDLIMSCLPIGKQLTSATFDSAHGPVVIKDDREAILLLQSCTHLHPGGLAIFVVSNNFIQVQKTNSVYANLERFGLYLDAALSLPTSTFAPYTTIPTTLVIIRRAQSERLFVGELSEDRKRNAELLKNLKARKPGPELPLGGLVDRQLFYGYSSLMAQYKAQELARNLRLEPIMLSDIAPEVNFTRATEYPGFEERPNAIYLPLVGRGNVITSLSQATLKQPSSYAQIVLDPEKAVALYAARFFNTNLGKLIREQLMSGLTIPRIMRHLIPQICIYLPDRTTQLTTIDAETKVINLISELTALQGRLWSQPRHLKQVLRDIEQVNREERFSDWLDTLPFPLASILWTYATAGDDHEARYRLLLHFFEALAEFLATVLLSGFANNPAVFQRKLPQLQRVLTKSNTPIDMSTFGTWVRIVENLAKEGRVMLNGPQESKSNCQAMFSTADQEFLAMLFSSEIISLLQQTNEYRNEWVGHGGMVTERISSERQTILANNLSKLRSIFSINWQNYVLIQAGSSRFISGIYHYRVKRIMGSRIPFEGEEMKTDSPMDYDQLYLLAKGERTPLKLLPLVKIMPSPKTELSVCYFYNCMQPDGIQFISYYFAEDADVTGTFKDTADTLRMLLGPMQGKEDIG